MEEENIFNNTFIHSVKFNKKLPNVFIYIANLSQCQNLTEKCWACLSTYEKSKAKKFHTGYLSELYIKAHGILRYILAYYTNCSVKNLEFRYNAYGKPYLKDSNIKFNISHSKDKVGYIVTFDAEVGIDIEYYNNDINFQEVGNLLFTPLEQIFFNTLDLNKQIKYFYNTWTKKEAIIKANGMGLSYPINTIETAIQSEELDNIILINKENNKKKIYCYSSFEIEKSWAGAAAIEREYVYYKF